MRCRGKVSEEALHVGSGCEAFHLETNAFPVQWAFSLSGICVCTCVSEKEERDTQRVRQRQHVCVHLQEALNIELKLTALQQGVEVCRSLDCIL